jgi:tRNA threonylcarbamoyladenosine biosynthesis protein TsaE
MKSISIKSLDTIDRAAENFLDAMGEVNIVAFSGEMGAGKTTLIQALCRRLGVSSEVNSPTFSLVNQYFTESGQSIFHFDLYRIEDPAELFDMGYEEYFFSGDLCFIEWPEKASHLIPDEALRVAIKVHEDQSRELQFEPAPLTKN